MLATLWFLILAFVLIGYALLDGFDLGAGIVHLYVARSDAERRTVLRAIGPVWDGNEVWLLVAGGALFAAFPIVYATIFSGFYLAICLLLLALILRAIAIEFRNQEPGTRWRQAWDVVFSIASGVAALVFGIALGNLLRGVDLVSGPVYNGGFAGLFSPFTVLVGVLALALAALQGSSWLVLKTDGPLAARARKTQLGALAAVAAVWAIATLVGIADARRIFDNFGGSPLAWPAPVLVVIGMGLVVWLARRGREFLSFLASSLVIFAMALLAGTALYPNLAPGTQGVSLTVTNSHSSDLSMSVMLVVALIGMPVVIAYTAIIYWRFRGKVGAAEEGRY